MNTPIALSADVLANSGAIRRVSTGRLMIVFATVAFLVYGLILVTFSHASYPSARRVPQVFPFLSDVPVNEDGLYMLTLAWNFGAGKGLSYNGGKVTTGTQPLSTITYGGLAFLVQSFGGDKWLLVRLVVVLGSLMFLVFAHLIGRIAQHLAREETWSSLAYSCGYLLALTSFPIWRLFTNGMETWLYLTALALVVYTEISSPEGRRPKLLLGVLIGLTALVRIDFLVIMAGWGVLRLIKDRFKAIPELMVMAVVAIIIVSPWFLWVHAQSGHWIPQSGPAESRWMTSSDAVDRTLSAITAVIQHLVPTVFSTYDTWHNGPRVRFFTLVSIPLLLGLLYWARPKSFVVERAKRSPAWQRLILWMIAASSLIVVYPLIFWATGFYVRYLAPLLIGFLPLLAVVIARKLDMLGDYRTVGAGFAATAMILFSAAVIFNFHTGRVENTHSITAGFVKQYYPTAKVGAFQSGVIGYFNENALNLDGKMDLGALHMKQQGRLEEYIESIQAEVIVDWGNSYIRKLLSAKWLETYWQPCSVKVPDGRTLCFVRLGPGGSPVVSPKGVQ